MTEVPAKVEKDTALVTGASGGVGAAIAVALGAAGYRVVVNFLTNRVGATGTVAMIESVGGEAISVRADVRRRSDVEKLFARTEEEFGFVGHLVNNAGVSADTPLMLCSDEQWAVSYTHLTLPTN